MNAPKTASEPETPLQRIPFPADDYARKHPQLYEWLDNNTVLPRFNAPVAWKEHWLITTAKEEHADEYLTKSLAFQAIGAMKSASEDKDTEEGMRSIRETITAFNAALEIAHTRLRTPKPSTYQQATAILDQAARVAINKANEK